MGKFKSGMFFGGLLGAGIMWMSLTKKGRAVRDELLDHAAVVYVEAKEKLMASDAWRQMNRSQFVVLVKDLVDRYAVKTGLAKELKELIVKVVVSQWQNLKQEMAEKDN